MNPWGGKGNGQRIKTELIYPTDTFREGTVYMVLHLVLFWGPGFFVLTFFCLLLVCIQFRSETQLAEKTGSTFTLSVAFSWVFMSDQNLIEW
jgi:hypothetical protein